MKKFNLNLKSGISGMVGLMLVTLSIGNVALAQIKPGHKPAKPTQTNCVPLGSWVAPGSGHVANHDVIIRAAENSVVLLGETHVNADHHRWQLQTLAALYAERPNMVIGFEMFPRRVQAVLDRWVAGELTEQEFLRVVEWGRVWNTDANLYLPLFHFARMNNIPMVALNIETRLRRLVSEKGFNGVPVEEREGLTRPAEPSQAYLDYLLPIYKQHDRKDKKDGDIDYDDSDFRRFIAGQQLWDRAMAEMLKKALTDGGDTEPLAVGIMGSGHVLHGFGVPHQLNDLGVKAVSSLLPWDNNRSCKQLVAGVADAVFGVLPHISNPFVPDYQRLGIRFEMSDGGAMVLQVEKDSIAEQSNIQSADIILEMAGLPLENIEDVIAIVKRHAPGTWMPLKVKRGKKEFEIIAKFPAIKK